MAAPKLGSCASSASTWRRWVARYTPSERLGHWTPSHCAKGARMILRASLCDTSQGSVLYVRATRTSLLRAARIRGKGKLATRRHALYARRTRTSLGRAVRTTGAGPAGLHMASRLKQLGCTNVTILERTFRYGGKTHTVHEYGNPNDIGTCWMHPGGPLRSVEPSPCMPLAPPPLRHRCATATPPLRHRYATTPRPPASRLAVCPASYPLLSTPQATVRSSS